MRNRVVTVVVAIAALAACRSTPTKPAGEGEVTGGPSPRGAVERFLAAVRAQDLQAMAVVWGTKNGPARDAIQREELEKREVIMTQCLANDSASFYDDVTTANGEHQVRFTLFRGRVTRTTTFTTEADPASRWYVKAIDLKDVHSCTVQAGRQVRQGAS